MVTYFCTTCWHASPSYLKSCPRCGSSDRFCTEQQYAELMIRYLHHPMRRYRLVALKNLTWLKWKDAIPEIRERIRIEKEPDVKAQARRTLESIETYHSRNDKPDSPYIEPGQTRQYALISEPVCKIIPIRQMLKKKGYHHLRYKKS
ncbi:MAG: hypothetical protein GXY48_04600 [Methanomicrobiales archaeon]|nr:hypothetical protein [Methanomicrobiales archaeon]